MKFQLTAMHRLVISNSHQVPYRKRNIHKPELKLHRMNLQFKFLHPEKEAQQSMAARAEIHSTKSNLEGK